MRTLKSILSFLAVVVVGVVLALGIRTFVAEVYEVPTGSMLETVQLGDRLIGEKISYRFRDPDARTKLLLSKTLKVVAKHCLSVS